MPTAETPTSDLEGRLHALEQRVHAVERRTLGTRPTGEWPAAPPARAVAAATIEQQPPPRPAAAPSPRPQRATVDLERLFGGQVLAWIGAVAVLTGLAMLFALGISEGWIDEGGRIALGGGLASVLVGVGVWLQERRGHTEAAQAAAAAGFGGLFLADTVASRNYELLAPELGLVVAAVIAVATAIVAIRWRAQVVGAVGIAGALLAPLLAGVPFGGATALYILVAACGATFVLLYERWTWLSFAVLIIPAVQWVSGIMGAEDWHAYGLVAVLLGFGAVNVVAALGVELRTGALLLRTPSAYLLALNALLLAIVGTITLSDLGGRDAGAIWLLVLAAGHVGAGLAVRGRARDLALFSYALATIVADIALTVADIDPTVRTIVWAASAVGAAGIARLRWNLPDGLIACGLGGQLALATMATLLELGNGGAADDTGLVIGLSALAAGCLVSGRLTATRPDWRMVLDSAGLITVAGLGFVAFDGVGLTLAWAAMAVALAQVARRTDDELSTMASALFLGGALVWCLGDQAPPSALLDGDVALGTAALGLGAMAVACVGVLRTLRSDQPERSWLGGVTAVVLLYLASIAVVALSPDGSVASGGTGQFALTALWAVAGLAALITGLRLRLQPVRLGALGLLGLAIGKVFLFDLATLTPTARVASFLALGVFLLLGAFAYQRLRPEVEA